MASKVSSVNHPLGALRGEAAHQQLHLAAAVGAADRHERVRRAEPAVVLGNLVFQDQVIAKPRRGHSCSAAPEIVDSGITGFIRQHRGRPRRPPPHRRNRPNTMPEGRRRGIHRPPHGNPRPPRPLPTRDQPTHAAAIQTSPRPGHLHIVGPITDSTDVTQLRWAQFGTPRSARWEESLGRRRERGAAGTATTARRVRASSLPATGQLFVALPAARGGRRGLGLHRGPTPTAGRTRAGWPALSRQGEVLVDDARQVEQPRLSRGQRAREALHGRPRATAPADEQAWCWCWRT